MLHCRGVVLLSVATLVLLAGCASNKVEIPTDAKLVAEGNERLVYEVPRSGLIYIYDEHDEELIYSGEVTRGQTDVIDAEEDEVLLDSLPLTERDLRRDHRVQIYFDDDRPIGDRRVIVEEERREIRRD